jgi:hypothetical protein
MTSGKRKNLGARKKTQPKAVFQNSSAFDELVEEVDLVLGKKKNPPGRPTVRPNILWGRRDDIAQMLEIEWGNVGWQLQGLRSPGKHNSQEDVKIALEPLQEKHGHERIAYLLRPTSVPATSDEVRSTFVALGKERRLRCPTVKFGKSLPST